MLIAGADGEKSQFPNGLQSDHLSEQTVGHGVRVQPITNPTAYPVQPSEVGAKLDAAGSATLSQSLTSIVSLPLTAGVWLVQYFGQVGGATAGDDCYMSANGSSSILAKDHVRLPTAASNNYAGNATLSEVRSTVGETVTLRAINVTAARGSFSGYVMAVRIA